MDYNFYLKKFESAFSQLDKEAFENSNIQLFVGIVMDSVVIKAYKSEWSSDLENPLTAGSRIFFSVWVNEKTIKENKLYYNIHALKLRQLKGYKITSRDFAERFRNQFVKQQENWSNVTFNYGPLTLMQGWQVLNIESLEKDIINLVQKFLKISPIIDQTLSYYKIP